MEIHELMDGYYISKCGRVFKEANYYIRGKKYLGICIAGKNYSVHRLMAEKFLPRIEGKSLVLHHNDDAMDNRLENLRWGDSTENYLDMVRNTKKPWNSRRRKRIKYDVFQEIFMSGMTQKEIAEKVGLSQSRISQIAKHIKNLQSIATKEVNGGL